MSEPRSGFDINHTRSCRVSAPLTLRREARRHLFIKKRWLAEQSENFSLRHPRLNPCHSSSKPRLCAQVARPLTPRHSSVTTNARQVTPTAITIDHRRFKVTTLPASRNTVTFLPRVRVIGQLVYMGRCRESICDRKGSTASTLQVIMGVQE
jgi:hypothetical protein